jgi:hypothetical protein
LAEKYIATVGTLNTQKERTFLFRKVKPLYLKKVRT